MSSLFLLLFIVSIITSIVYFFKFLINVLRKKPAKRKLVFSGYFFGSSIICIIVFSLFTPETYQKETNHIDKKETEKTSSEILTLPQKTNDKENLLSDKDIKTDNKHDRGKKLAEKELKKEEENKKRKKEARLANKKQEKEEAIFNKGMDYFSKRKFKKAYKQFSKIPKESYIYDRSRMYQIISQNEQSLNVIAKRYIKSDKANLRILPMQNSPIDTVLTKNIKLDLCYTYGNWSRVYRQGEDNWILPDVPELNGWIHSSLLEDEVQYNKRMDEKREIEEQKRKEKEAEMFKQFTNWQVQYFLKAPVIVQDIEPMWVETNIIGIKLFVTSLNKIMIENVGIDVAYNLQRYFGSDISIHIFINVGHSEVAEVEWSIWNQRYECKFK